VDYIRYLGILIVPSRVFTRLLDHAKKSFYRAADAIFAKVGRIASEEVTVHKSKCFPVLLYGLDACRLTESDLISLHFTDFTKLFVTKNIETV